MREIKFRGETETTEGKKWVYGYYYKVKSFFDNEVAHFIGVIRNNHLTDFNIDENTLGQYTGLHDKNGKEIYEGDVVNIDLLDVNLLNVKGVVQYKEKYAQFVIVETGTVAHECEELGDYIDYKIEVIGNIYNKNLLESEDKQ